MSGLLLTPREVAERLAVSSRTVYLWIEQGRLPAVRLSERITRVPAEAVDELIERATDAGSSAAIPVGAETPAAYATRMCGPGVSTPDVTPAERRRLQLSTNRSEILRIADRRRVDNVRIIGSVARGDAREDSDIDLLVDLQPSASLYDLGGFAGEVEALLGVEVDVAVSDGLKPRIRQRVLREAVPL
ncbi:MAG: nucleotidyltransferase domain-containing protein [Anaerosomatales bacterium]|nr:excisionase family DNA-binding protein [Coriobacteriia bacterium]